MNTIVIRDPRTILQIYQEELLQAPSGPFRARDEDEEEDEPTQETSQARKHFWRKNQGVGDEKHLGKP